MISAVLYLFGPPTLPFAQQLAKQIDALWPGHPPLHVVEPAVGEPWVAELTRGVVEIRRRFPGSTHVMVLIDDHCPLAVVDPERVERYAAFAETRSIGCLHFVTYEWPWLLTGDSVDEHGRLMGWRERSVEESGDLMLANVPREFFRFYQVQPTVWNLDYLETVCEYAAETGASSAWDFEEMLPGPAGRHAVAAYPWPCVHHGFLQQGRVNYEALRMMKHPATVQLATQLKRRLAMEHGPFAYERLRFRRALHLDGVKYHAKRLLFR